MELQIIILIRMTHKIIKRKMQTKQNQTNQNERKLNQPKPEKKSERISKLDLE